MKRPQHVLIGALAGALTAVTTFVRAQDPHESFEWWELVGFSLAGAGIGAAVSLLPDVLEPATSPYHRGFFHSLAFLLIEGAITCWYTRTTASTNLVTQDAAVLSAAAGYASHLFADAFTPMSLPLLADRM